MTFNNHLEKMEAVAQARAAATRRIIEAHRQEYDRIHGEEREQRGLDPTPGSETIAALRARIRELEEALAGATE